MTVTEESEKTVREFREKAVEWADRVRAGDPDVGEAPTLVMNDDVGETDSPSPEVVEVDQDETIDDAPAREAKSDK